MDIIVRGKNLPLTEAIVSYVEAKFGRMERYWSGVERITVTCSVEPTREVEGRHHVEANAIVGGIQIHGEEQAGSLYVAIDSLADKLEQQLRRKKGQVSKHPRSAVWAEPTRAEAEAPLTLVRPENVEPGKEPAVAFGRFPNLLEWGVVGPQGKQVGRVTGLYVHPEHGEIVALVVAADDKEFTVPLAEAAVEIDARRVRLRRNLGQMPPPSAEVRSRETPLRHFLVEHDVPEPLIERLEASGVRTPRDLRLRVEEGRLEALLGNANREGLREIERLIEEYS